jgi:hypothetical protein
MHTIQRGKKKMLCALTVNVAGDDREHNCMTVTLVA